MVQAPALTHKSNSSHLIHHLKKKKIALKLFLKHKGKNTNLLQRKCVARPNIPTSQRCPKIKWCRWQLYLLILFIHTQSQVRLLYKSFTWTQSYAWKMTRKGVALNRSVFSYTWTVDSYHRQTNLTTAPDFAFLKLSLLQNYTSDHSKN